MNFYRVMDSFTPLTSLLSRHSLTHSPRNLVAFHKGRFGLGRNVQKGTSPPTRTVALEVKEHAVLRVVSILPQLQLFGFAEGLELFYGLQRGNGGALPEVVFQIVPLFSLGLSDHPRLVGLALSLLRFFSFQGLFFPLCFFQVVPKGSRIVAVLSELANQLFDGVYRRARQALLHALVGGQVVLQNAAGVKNDRPERRRILSHQRQVFERQGNLVVRGRVEIAEGDGGRSVRAVRFELGQELLLFGQLGPVLGADAGSIIAFAIAIATAIATAIGRLEFEFFFNRGNLL
mmetsp:Transcript_4891/g.11936  ORF Transcript_4891/g.11936 Transcript_4891/m.11936 type:complete len:289 (-) Transcript_4891:316-1182(-)